MNLLKTDKKKQPPIAPDKTMELSWDKARRIHHSNVSIYISLHFLRYALPII